LTFYFGVTTAGGQQEEILAKLVHDHDDT